MLHRNGHFTHDGQPIRHERLRLLLERSVRYSEAEDVFIVQAGRFRGQIEIEATPFFVRAYDVDTGLVSLSDRTAEPLSPETLRIDIDDAFVCRVKQRFEARFTHAAQSLLLAAVSFDGERAWLELGGRRVALDLPAAS